MPGLVPAIHVVAVARPQDVDARDKRGHDGREQCVSFVMAGLVPAIHVLKVVQML
jgi:hypothetical protein